MQGPPRLQSFLMIHFEANLRALVAGRPAVAIEDIQSIALPALRHRIALNFEGQAEGLTTDDIVRNIVQTLPIDVPMPASS